MSLKIAINGFGRIGRNILRAYIQAPRAGMQIVAINGQPVKGMVLILVMDLLVIALKMRKAFRQAREEDAQRP